ncbi:hypothetical protein Tco_0103608 [Tanacetum coccineum]
MIGRNAHIKRQTKRKLKRLDQEVAVYLNDEAVVFGEDVTEGWWAEAVVLMMWLRGGEEGDDGEVLVWWQRGDDGVDRGGVGVDQG